MTFLTDLDNLIRHHHGDVKKLREIRDTIRHDNFITTEDKNYVQSLIDDNITNRPLEKTSRRQTNGKIKLQTKSKTSDPYSQSNFTFNFSSNKKVGILAGAVAAIAIIVIAGFGVVNQDDMINSTVSSTPNNPLLVTVDQTQYQHSDIISISGDTRSDNELVTLSIENTNGVKIWKEDIEPKNDGNFSTLLIAAGGGWKDSGTYTLKAIQDGLIKEIKFKFVA